MGNVIHAQQKDGEMRFRIWNTIVDGYESGVLTEEELRKKLKEKALEQASEDFERDFPRRVERAKKGGTSSVLENRDIEGDWDQKL
ncbi:MAG: hypothetical protein KGI50_03535 [Patescibacteria group bacterium]|nr:hypothetical protein [Patescibacteria group bacterium]MDE2438363.1 hypothetical protein [Patescibacteria group bacterium]